MTVSIPEENEAQFPAAEAIHTVPIVVSPGTGTHYRWVDRGGMDSLLSKPCPMFLQMIGVAGIEPQTP